MMTVTVTADKIPDATGNGTDEEFDRAHAGILPPVTDRLIGDDPMRSTGNVVAGPAMVCDSECHIAPF